MGFYFLNLVYTGTFDSATKTDFLEYKLLLLCCPILYFELILEFDELLMLPFGSWLLDEDFFSASLFPF